MRRKLFMVVSIFLLIFIMAGCHQRLSHINGSYLAPTAQINPEYEIIGDVTGTGSCSYIGFYPIPFSLMTVSDGRDMAFGFKTFKKAKQAAIKDALAKNSDADTIIVYRVEEEKTKGLFWFKKSTVTVKAKVIKFK